MKAGLAGACVPRTRESSALRLRASPAPPPSLCDVTRPARTRGAGGTEPSLHAESGHVSRLLGVDAGRGHSLETSGAPTASEKKKKKNGEREIDGSWTVLEK